jgi:hypothetical protein
VASFQSIADMPRLASSTSRATAIYENARHFLGLSEQGWVNWSEEVRRRCGKELLRRGMFPLRKYFKNAA